MIQLYYHEFYLPRNLALSARLLPPRHDVAVIVGQDGDEVPAVQLARAELSKLLGVVQEIACIVSLDGTSAIAGFRLGFDWDVLVA